MRSDLRWVVALAVLGAAGRVAAARWLGDVFHFRDEAIYADAARRLLAGEGFGAAYTNVPAYPLVLAALAAPWPGSLLLLRSAQAVLAGAGVLLVWLLGRRALGPGPALVASALYALDPMMLVAGGLLYPEAVAAMVLLAVLLAAWTAAREDRMAYSATAGLLVGALAQIRPVALTLIPVVAAWTALAASRRRAGHGVLVVAVALLVLVPWTARNYALQGALVPISKAGTAGSAVGGDAVARRGLTASLALWAWEDPVAAVRRTATEFVRFWELYPTRLAVDDPGRRARMHAEDPRLPEEPIVAPGLRDRVSAVSFGLELALALVGLGLALRRRPAVAVLLATVSVVYGLGYALFIAKLRYRITVLPCLFLLAGLAVATLARARRTPADGGGSARVPRGGER